MAPNNNSFLSENDNNVFINENNNDAHYGTQNFALGTQADENLTEIDSIDEMELEPVLDNVNNDLDLTKTIYVVFDLETTGFTKERNNIFEIAAQIIDPIGIPIPDATFTALVNPQQPLSPWNLANCGVTNTEVITAPPFSIVAEDFLQFISNSTKAYMDDNETEIDHICLVAHNGYVFDVPFLMYKLFFSRNQHILRFFTKIIFIGYINIIQRGY